MIGINLGVVGLRGLGINHIRRAQDITNVNVIAIADSNEERLREAGNEFGIDHCYNDASLLFEHADLDGVVLAVPNHLHAPLAVQALSAGINVLVEKPIASNKLQAQQMIEARDLSGKCLMVGYNQRFQPQVPSFRRHLMDGSIGKVVYARALWNRRAWGTETERGNWFLDPKLSGGGPLVDLGIHKLDLALHLMGYPEVSSVFGFTTQGIGRAHFEKKDSEWKIEDAAVAMIRFMNGSVLHLESSFYLNTETESQHKVVFYGDKGGAIATHDEKWRVFLATQDGNENLPLELDDKWASTSVEHFVQVLRGESELSATAEEALIGLGIIEAIYESASVGYEVKFAK